MAAYRQSCICFGQRRSSQRDQTRYEDKAFRLRREAMFARRDLFGLEKRIPTVEPHQRGPFIAQREVLAEDIRVLLREALRMEARAARAFELSTTVTEAKPCLLCGDTGTLTGNGSAQIGGSGRFTGVAS